MFPNPKKDERGRFVSPFAPTIVDGEERAARRIAHQTAMRHARQYRFGPGDYDAMVAKQHGRCAICQEIPDRPLQIDHCHMAGDARELLCGRCNTGLGHFYDSEALLVKAAAYLTKHRSRRAA
jgi:Recombination endonuclease VII